MTEQNDYQENNTVGEMKEKAVKNERPEVVTRKVNVEGLKDLEKLLDHMTNIDKEQMENMDKMYALDVTFEGKPSNPYFTLCRFIQELNNKLEKQ